MLPVHSIAEVVKGTLVQEGKPIVVDHILTDSRKITFPQSSIFIPIVTTRRNAHQFLLDVYQSGVRVFLVSETIETQQLPGAWIILVPETIEALQRLVAYHRKQFHIPIIGITGSNGKTVVKEWLYQLLESEYEIVRSPKSFNSQIGVPLSVWQLDSTHNLGIFEAGISQAGEMDRLEKMIRPDIGIFTNIGETHNEGFLNIRHKITEKLKLFTHCNTLIYCKDHSLLNESILQFANNQNEAGNSLRLFTWSTKQEADVHIASIVKGNGSSVIRAQYVGKEMEIQIPFIDDAHIEDAIHCWLVMLWLKVDSALIADRFKKITAVAMRLEIINGSNGCTLINDTYNSDVSSFTIALDVLTQQNQHEKRTVILSDIFQSGRDHELYDEVAALLKEKKIQRFIGIGEAILRNKTIFRQNRKLKSNFYRTTQDFLDQIDTSEFQQESILIKGARKFEFEKITRRLQERIHQTVVEVNLSALLHNYKAYQSLLQPQVKVMAMVKAFSYGSGSFEVANVLQFEGTHYLAVAYTDEGVHLRKAGIQLPIMVMNAEESSFPQLIEWKLEPEIFNVKLLLKLIEALQEQEQDSYPIHLKLDTGMHRLGFSENELPDLLQLLSAHPEIKIQSVFSHLSGSEEVELDSFTQHQAALFNRMCEQIHQQISYPFLRHLCNSSGIVRHPELQYDMVRLGIGLYGVDVTGKLPLRNVSKLKTQIAQIKQVPVNETVGYNRKGILNRDTRIGTVCVGYADGIPRRLGNGKGKMMLHGKWVSIVGNVCMDMCMLDITDVPEAQEGDTVVVFGDELPVTQVAAWADTIPYEILTGISQRVKRVYINE
jgi:alanine racemase